MTSKRIQELMMISLEKCIELYLSTLETEGKSPRYIGWLKDRLRYFSAFMRQSHGGEIKIQDLTVQDGRESLRDLMNRDVKYRDHPMIKQVKGKLQIQYIHGCGRAVRSFSTFANEEGYLEENVMRKLKLPQLPKTFPEPLTEAEIEKVLYASLENTQERLRNYAIMMLFLDTGIRLSELVNLKLSKVDLAGGEMVIFGKGSKERRVPIGSQAKKALIDYMAHERGEAANPNDEDILFLNEDQNPITGNVVEKVLQRIKKAAKVPRLHPHICRHTFSVRFLINGGDVFSLQKILGHTSLEMTRKYVNLASGDVKEMHRRYSPMDNMNFRVNKRGRPRLMP
jgi:site-specific recombinase XerD